MRSVLRIAATALAAGSALGPLQAQEAAPPAPPAAEPAVTPLTPAVMPPLPRGVMPPVAMREMTPAEARAHQAWSLRAALNVAALQCQFSPFLRTVKNYNLMLPHHSVELAAALKTMNGHFVRHDGKAARQTFDQYTTRTYNSFSTLEAQLSFCQKASDVSWEAIAARKGEYGNLAAARLSEIRTALIPTVNPLLLLPSLGWPDVPAIANPCLDRKGREIPIGSKKCTFEEERKRRRR